MSNYTEQRHFSRIPFDAEVRITDPQDNATYSARLLDISLKGALTTQPNASLAEIGKTYQLELSLTATGNVIRLQMEASIAHRENGRIGFQYQNMDLDTAAHLYRLVELNLGDDKLMERELAELVRFNN
ncbi:MAG: PilZ domain-containing protein [Gammaproteobacteria bacterium]|nr:PilZ domain-containing protein [Gammaproteobacteria bacterium]